MTEEDVSTETNEDNYDVSIITSRTKKIWRQCLKDVQTLYIPNAVAVRPMKTQNAFVTKAIVLLAYLIVHAENNKPLPRISGKFKIDPIRDKTKEMETEIHRSGVDYTNMKLSWNTYTSAAIHIGACLCIGSWLANQLHKAKHYGTWKVIDGQVIGSTKGLYEPYKDLLQKVGITMTFNT